MACAVCAALLLVGCAGGTGSGGTGSSIASPSGTAPGAPTQFGGEEFARSCAGVASPAAPDVTVPAGFPEYDGWVGTLRATQGKTLILFGRAAAPDDVGIVQARQRELLEQAGLRIVSTDREGQAEAEISFAGRTEGSVQITPLCRGTVQVRYRIVR